MLNNLRVDPLEQRLLQRVRLVPRNLVLQNQRPEQTKDQLQITVDDVLRVDVDQLDTVRNDELERLVRVFQPRHPHLRVLVELEVDLLLPHRFKQRNHRNPSSRSFSTSLTMYAPFNWTFAHFVNVFCVDPVWSVAHDGMQWFQCH